MRMKLPSNVLAKLALGSAMVASAGCETAVDFERRQAAPAPLKVEVTKEPVVVELELPRFAEPPPEPAVAPRTKHVPAPTPVLKVKPKSTPKPQAIQPNSCGPCGMG
jgi:hypothetical protein